MASTVVEGIAQEDDPDLQVQLVLLAASHHNLESLRTLLRTCSASVQDPETGFTPLHAAVAACDPEPLHELLAPKSNLGHGQESHTNGHPNGNTNGDSSEPDVEAAAKIMRLLLQNGAIWNDVDDKNETPGCLALRLGLKELYDIMVDAGVRAEMLLNRLDEYEQLQEKEDEEDQGDVDLQTTADCQDEDKSAAAQGDINGQAGPKFMSQNPTTSTVEDDLRNENFLQSSLRFQDGRILDGNNNGVMMAWETDIMKRTADLIAPKPGLRILNIGHGMGIIDTFIQGKAPCSHHIIEAHPAVVERMKKENWDQKSNVTIHEGRWQDIVPKIMEQGTLFDAVYFDTFAEDYKALRDFFSDYMIGLLDDGGKWSFFNGLGADRQICYDVYVKVVEMDLFEAGFDTGWETIKVPEPKNEEWEGVKQRYWTLREYKLPICEFIG